VLLKDQPDIAPRAPQVAPRHIGHPVPKQKDSAPIGFHQPGQAAKQGGFTGAAGPEQRDNLARLDAKADLAEHRLAGVGFAEADNLDCRFGQISLRRSQALS
jgi:hypothetical protein